MPSLSRSVFEWHLDIAYHYTTVSMPTIILLCKSILDFMSMHKKLFSEWILESNLINNTYHHQEEMHLCACASLPCSEQSKRWRSPGINRYILKMKWKKKGERWKRLLFEHCHLGMSFFSSWCHLNIYCQKGSQERNLYKYCWLNHPFLRAFLVYCLDHSH